MMLEGRPVKWTCLICGAERLDADISVYKATLHFKNGTVAPFHVRHCNDRPQCIARVPEYADLYQQAVAS